MATRSARATSALVALVASLAIACGTEGNDMNKPAQVIERVGIFPAAWFSSAQDPTVIIGTDGTGATSPPGPVAVNIGQIGKVYAVNCFITSAFGGEVYPLTPVTNYADVQWALTVDGKPVWDWQKWLRPLEYTSPTPLFEVAGPAKIGAQAKLLAPLPATPSNFYLSGIRLLVRIEE